MRQTSVKGWILAGDFDFNLREFSDRLDHGWTNFLTSGPEWVPKFDRGPGAGAGGRIVLVTHPRRKNVSSDL